MSYYYLLEKFFRLKKALNMKAVHELKELDIWPKQASILHCINKFGPMSSAKLAEHTLSDPAAITRSVDLLAESGMVEKKDSSNDRRAWELHLTSNGEKMAKEIGRKQETLANELFSKLSAKDREAFSDLMDKIINTLEAKPQAEKEK
jgi:MarR family transcriptional regulator, transcriptional regulator for hemolysin